MALPSVLLHDHLDGGPRASTLVELAAETGYERLPASNAEALADWFEQGRSGSLERYLQAFVHTVGLMQTEDALVRVPYEAALDLTADGVVYAEIRFAPSLLTEQALTRRRAVEAVAAGLGRGGSETGLRWGLILDAMRESDDSEVIARLAVETRHLGVVAFDLAGPEKAFPPDLHLAGCPGGRRSRDRAHHSRRRGGRAPQHRLGAAALWCAAARTRGGHRRGLHGGGRGGGGDGPARPDRPRPPDPPRGVPHLQPPHQGMAARATPGGDAPPGGVQHHHQHRRSSDEPYLAVGRVRPVATSPSVHRRRLGHRHPASPAPPSAPGRSSRPCGRSGSVRPTPPPVPMSALGAEPSGVEL